jgi:hypothetical protein
MRKVWTCARAGVMIEVKGRGNIALDGDGEMFNNC